MIIKLTDIQRIEGNVITLKNGKSHIASLPVMTQIATEGKSILHGMDIVCNNLQRLYDLKKVKMEILQCKIAMDGFPEHAREYNDLAGVIDGVAEALHYTQENRECIMKHVRNASIWLCGKGVII